MFYKSCDMQLFLRLALIFFGLFFFGNHVLVAQENLAGRDLLIRDVQSLLDRDTNDHLAYRKRDWEHDLDKGMHDTLLFYWVQRVGLENVDKGNHAAVVGMFNTALDYFSQCEFPDKDLYMFILRSRLGALYEEMGLWSRAMKIYLDALSLCPDATSYQEFGNILNNIGNVYFKQGYYDEARLYYDSAIAVNIRSGNTKELTNNYNNLAGLYYMQGDYSKTIAALNQATAQIDPQKDPDLYYLMLQNLAVVYNKQGNSQIARGFIEEAMAYYEKEQKALDMIQSYLVFSDILSKTQSDLSKVYLDRALETARSVKNPAVEITVLQAQYTWYKEKEMYKESCETLESVMRLQDSLEAMDNRMRIESIEATNLVENESRNKDMILKQMRIKQLEGQKQRVVLVSLLFCLLIGMGVLIYYFLLQKQMKKRSEEVALQKQELYEKEKLLMDQKEQELREALELRNKELTSKVLHLVKTNEYIADVNKELQQILLELNPKDQSKKQRIRELLVKLRNQSDEGTSAEFRYYFEQVYHSFYENLQKEYPSLTYKDLRLCSFLKLGLSTKEIASITFKEVRSVESARNRLRKKMNLDTDVNLIEFFARF